MKKRAFFMFELNYLLQIEDVVVEVKLQLLVGVVDAKLLKAVVFKVLEAKNVQDSDGQALKMDTQTPWTHGHIDTIMLIETEPRTSSVLRNTTHTH